MTNSSSGTTRPRPIDGFIAYRTNQPRQLFGMKHVVPAMRRAGDRAIVNAGLRWAYAALHGYARALPAKPNLGASSSTPSRRALSRTPSSSRLAAIVTAPGWLTGRQGKPGSAASVSATTSLPAPNGCSPSANRCPRRQCCMRHWRDWPCQSSWIMFRHEAEAASGRRNRGARAAQTQVDAG